MVSKDDNDDDDNKFNVISQKENGTNERNGEIDDYIQLVEEQTTSDERDNWLWREDGEVRWYG